MSTAANRIIEEKNTTADGEKKEIRCVIFVSAIILWFSYVFVLFFAIIHSVRGYNSGEIWQDLPKTQGQNELYEQPKNYRQKYWKWPKVIDKTSVLVVDGGENSTIEQKTIL